MTCLGSEVQEGAKSCQSRVSIQDPGGVVDLDVLRPRGGKQAPGAGDDLRNGPDDDEKLAPLDLCLVFERPVLRNTPGDERARQAAQRGSRHRPF